MRTPPGSEQELLVRAQALHGRTLGAIATELGRPGPTIPARGKGWIGTLLEQALGASAGSAPEPDFPGLGIELKTIPLSPHGRVLESTYVCTLVLRDAATETWEQSLVRRKLARVLWMPIVAERRTPLATRVVGEPRCWSPSEEELQVLRADWQEIIDATCLGELDMLSSELGVYLQIRPKAMHGRARTRMHDGDGAPGWTLPRGFYLRPEFTGNVLRRSCRD
ncbi:MAG: DNA mismatch repair endonuclease MutH [Gammaproteobacteria bacterium]|nr:DNA mismatch repair endonuclease MutH [Gammaproteobacteria bacterium]